MVYILMLVTFVASFTGGRIIAARPSATRLPREMGEMLRLCMRFAVWAALTENPADMWNVSLW